MNLHPLLGAPALTQIHVAAAIAALLLGPVVLLRSRRDALHRLLGRCWVGLMLVVALSSFGIWRGGVVGNFSVIHALSVLVLLSLWSGIRAARAGQIKAHQTTFRSLYVYGLIVPGLFTLVPGRMMNDTLFAAMPKLAWVVIVAGLLVVVIAQVAPRQRWHWGAP